MASVLVSGNGVAHAVAARLLRSEEFKITSREQRSRSHVPIVMLSEAALALLRDVSGQAALFADRTPVARRVVAWGQAEPMTMPHVAVVVSGSELAEHLSLPGQVTTRSTPLFTIHDTPPGSSGELRQFGQRRATGTMVDLAPHADEQACFVEATVGGWLFLIPCGAGKAWLLGVGAKPDALLEQSRLVARQVGALGSLAESFETAPRMYETLAGDDWLACGTGALAFDPICGDGTAQTAREGILAAAVIAGIHAGDDSAALLGHYQAMLLAAMRRHLQISLPFYRGGGDTPWWREQAEASADGYAWCTARLAMMPEPHFVLRGTRLIRREQAA